MKLLIVEDEERIANLLRRGLVEKSFAVDIARYYALCQGNNNKIVSW
jgi:DNA-binding response OmpR family regulator